MVLAMRILELIREAVAKGPQWLGPAIVLIGALLLSLLVHWAVFRILRRWVEADNGIAGSSLRQAKRPMRLAFVLAALAITVPRTDLPWRIQDVLGHIFLILLIVLIGWTFILVTQRLSDRVIRRQRMDLDDNLAARKLVTQFRVLRRTATILLVIFTVTGVLLTFEPVQKYGGSLFASAGAAGLILGLAARPVLANLIAGIQIAITQPIRLEDVVIVDGEWGWIEEIFATYVVVRIWDWRRMLVPLSYFIEQPFQNWTRENASIIGAVHWYLDYTVPTTEVREKLEEIVRESPHWDGQVINLQVTDADKDAVVLRGLMSARTSPQAWDLRCEVREKLIAWLQEAYPEALPRLRAELVSSPADTGATPA
ncbi:small-conductance mechanosensitive channel [Thioclava sp. ES.031]|uniref:mechanosensitive ion channel family protein n=1 Tax=unclassified Thioclava TaxID=2621713 RepID=UPI000C018EEF|nr:MULTISPECIES: mechanosensitive ion channel family protein [unclassified Thioclava]PFG63875.1 small-conductance mechanosensitive channel [Thioclava sp. ES.031]